MSRDHVLSIRLTESERADLQRQAAERGCSASDLIRDLIRGELAPPLPHGGETAGSDIRVVETSAGYRQAGVIWDDGTVGSTLTVRHAA